MLVVLGLAALIADCANPAPLDPASRQPPNADATSILIPYESPVDLGTLGGTISIARAINDRDDVVGESRTAGELPHAFLYTAGVMHDLGTLGGDQSAAWDINDAGQVSGTSLAS